MAEPADLNVDELRRRARRRLVGAVVLALGVAVVVPMLLETEQKPLGDDVSVKIPPVDEGKFVNRLSDTTGGAKAPAASDAASGSSSAPRAPKYDTKLPVEAPAASTPASSASAGGSPSMGAQRSEVPPPPTKSQVSESPSGTSPSQATASSATPAAPPHETFAVQLAAFADDKGANALAGRLKKAGYAAYTEPLKTSKGTLWRVRVGPYPSRDAAVVARDKLKTEGQSGIVAAVK